MRSAQHYRDQMLQLQPPGVALPTGPDSTWAQLLEALGIELSRLDARCDDLLVEIDPRDAGELLPDWERLLGLPGECAPADQTLGERRESAITRLSEVGSQDPQYFVDIAASLGFEVTITEHRPFVAGSLAGEDLTNTDEWIFTWDMNVPALVTTFFSAGQSSAGEPLQVWDREDRLECEIKKRRPAHTQVRFIYG